MKALLLAPLLILGSAASSNAQALLLDFESSLPPSGSDLTNSPYHTANPSFTDTNWNLVTSGTAPSLVYSDGTAATGITLSIGSTTGSSTVPPTSLTLSGSPALTFSALGGAVKTGIYANNSVGKGGVFIGGGANTTFGAVGIQIGGLAAGTYNIYITAQNTSSSSTNYRQNIYAGASSSSGDFTFSQTAGTTGNAAVGDAAVGYSLATIAYNGTNSTSAWTQATGDSPYGNYVELSVTLTSGEFLNIASIGQYSELRGFLNSVEIVNVSAIPEPSTCAALAGLAALGVVIIRRNRARRPTNAA